MNILLSLLLLVFSLSATSFSKSKKILLKKVYFDKQFSFYCSNPYEIKRIKGKYKTLIIEDKQYYSARKPFYKSGKINIRAKRIEWEHIMPAHNFGKHLSCWKKGGRKACRKDKIFKAMEADMHNLVPAIGEVNANRSNYRFGALSPHVKQYGICEVQIDFKKRRAYVRDEIKGDIARIYFYMSDKYNIRMSKQEKNMMKAWNKLDPIDEWEILKNSRLLRLQGQGNKYIMGAKI
ncbi:MAG: endonuclease [Campylobacteraceae bacterium]|nr:endonuclease [Campylobacteraceae bacterium]